MICEQIINETDNMTRIRAIDDYLFGLIKPQVYGGVKGIEVQFIKKFEEMNLVMSQLLKIDVRGMTTLEYYQAFELLKKTQKKGINKARD